jgi:hypothetical protein
MIDFQLFLLHLTKMLLGATYDNGQHISSDRVRKQMNTVFQSTLPPASPIPSSEPAVFNEPSLTSEGMSAAGLASGPSWCDADVSNIKHAYHFRPDYFGTECKLWLKNTGRSELSNLS